MTNEAKRSEESGSTVWLDTELGFVAAFLAELQAKQEPFGDDFAKALYENILDLYES